MTAPVLDEKGKVRIQLLTLDEVFNGVARGHEKTVIAKPNQRARGVLANFTAICRKNWSCTSCNSGGHAADEVVESLVVLGPLSRIILGAWRYQRCRFLMQPLALPRTGSRSAASIEPMGEWTETERNCKRVWRLLATNRT